ncbi:PP2C family serine/threonine-protein phosphatase [Methylobacterium sp. CM6241]
MAVAKGTSHEASNTPCQDQASCRVIETSEGPVLVAIVCDGAGSAAHAEIGAWLAAETMMELVELHFEEGGRMADVDLACGRAWLVRVADALTHDAAAQGRSVRDYACTLLVAVVAKGSAAFLQIGDGAIVISRGEDEDWSYVFWPQHGEFANTTNFVVSRDAADLLEFAYVPEPLQELALFSDGLENLVLHHATKTVFEPFFRQMIAPVRRAAESGLDVRLSSDLTAYLSSPRVCERTDDDKSLVLASRLLSA